MQPSMNSQVNGSADEVPRQLAERLVAYEEAKAAGTIGRIESASAEAAIGDRLARDVACVDLLHRVWPAIKQPATADAWEQAARPAGEAQAGGWPGEAQAGGLRQAGRLRHEQLGRLPHQQLGDFRIVREIGHGGMGVVYEAEQLTLGRRVALKLLPYGVFASEQQQRRFMNEARAAATLQHPHIVAVYSVAGEGSARYYTMQLIDGPSLAELVGELRAESGERRAESKERGAESGEQGAESLASVARPNLIRDNRLQLPADTRAAAAESTWREWLHPDPLPKGEGILSTNEREGSFSTSEGEGSFSTLARHVASIIAAEYVEARPAYFRRVARWGVQLAEALAYAHASGVLHRDIKPANILLDESGKPWITDFGLARLATEATMTLTGDLLGTLRYMAPEQALGKRAAVDHRADVYSLGMTLYELLVLRPAFAGHDREELLRQIAFDEPRPLRKIDRKLPTDLDVIVRKAVNKSPGDRYESAQELADDLRRYLDGKPILARPPALLERAAKWARRRPAAAALAIVSVLAVAALWAGTIWHARTLAAALDASEENRKQAEANEQTALAREESLKQNQYAVNVKLASEALKTGNRASALQLLSPYQDNTQETHRRGFEWHYLWNQCHHSDLATLDGHTKQVNMVGYSPDDKLLVSASDDGTVRIWDGQTHKLVSTLAGHSKCVNEFAFAPDGRWLATASCDGTVKLWDLSTFRELETFIDLGEPIWCISVSPDGKTIATASGSAPDPNNGTKLIIWDMEKHSRILEPAVEDLRVASVAFSPDGRQLVTAGGDFVRVWSTDDGRELANAAQFGANCIRYSRDGSVFVTMGIASAPTVVLWEPPLGLKTVFRPQFSANAVAISDDNSLVAAGTNGSTIELWDTKAASRRSFFYGHRDWLRAIAFRHDGHRVVSGGNGNASPPFVKVWDVTKEPGLKFHLKLESKDIQSVAFDRALTEIAYRDSDSVISIWDLETENIWRRLGQKRTDSFFDGRKQACFSDNGAYLAAPSVHGEVEVWEVASGNRVAALHSSRGEVSNLRFSGDDRSLVGLTAAPIPNSRNGPGVLGVVTWDVPKWTLRDDKVLVHFTEGEGVQTTAVHPYGDIVAVGTAKAILLYSVSTGQLLASLDARYAWKSKLDLFADGDLLIYGVNDGYAVLRDWRKRAELHRFVGNSGSVHAFTLSPNGKTLAIGDGEGTVRLFDRRTGQELLRLETTASDVAALQFSADGKRLACWNRETGFVGSSEIRVWSIEQ